MQTNWVIRCGSFIVETLVCYICFRRLNEIHDKLYNATDDCCGPPWNSQTARIAHHHLFMSLAFFVPDMLDKAGFVCVYDATPRIFVN